MERYIFSGGTTRQIMDYLTKMPGFEPFDVLVSQLDRSSIKSMMQYQDEGKVRSLFIDSGAFSVHTGKATVDLEEYIEFVNSIDDRICAVAQLDTIPGTFGKPKTAEDYQESARKSWENFLYMYPRMKSPEKLIPVFHYGESFDALRHMLEWKDDNGRPLSYVGISPANDTSQKTKNVYLQNVYDIIAKSCNPNIRTHLFGMTAIDALSKFPAYSADSVSHRLQSAYAKVFIPKYGVVSVSKNSRTSKSKSNLSFLETADDVAIQYLKDYIGNLGITLEEIQESNAARCAVCMYTIMQQVKEKSYKPENVTRSKKLFELPG